MTGRGAVGAAAGAGEDPMVASRARAASIAFCCWAGAVEATGVRVGAGVAEDGAWLLVWQPPAKVSTAKPDSSPLKRPVERLSA
jgi:hypothetical protein